MVSLRRTAPSREVALAFLALVALPACLETHKRGERGLAPAAQEESGLPPICEGFKRTRRTRLLAVIGSHVLRHDAPVTALALSKDGRVLLSAGNDSVVKVWEARTGKELTTFAGHKKEVLSVAISPDGKRALSGGDTVKLWETGDGSEVKTLAAHEGEVTQVAFVPGSPRALSAGKDGKLVLWDLETGDVVRSWEKAHPCGVYSLAVSPSGELALAGGLEGRLKLFDLATGRELVAFEDGHLGTVNAIAFVPGSLRAVSAGDDHFLRLWDIASGKELAKLEGHGNRVSSVAVSPDGSRAISASADATLRLWDLAGASGEGTAPGERLPGHGRELRAVVFSPDGKHAFSGCADGTIESWDLDSRKSLATGHRGAVTSLHARGDLLLTGSTDHGVRLWSAATGRLVRELKHDDTVVGVAFSPDRQHALSATPVAIRLWDLESGTELWARRAKMQTASLALSSDGFLYLTGKASYSSPLDMGAQEKRVGYAYGVLALGMLDRDPRVSDVALGPETRQFAARENACDEVTAVAFSPDGKTAFTGGTGCLELWGIETGRIKATLAGHKEMVDALCVSPDGRHALTGSRDGAVVFWDLVAKKVAERLKGHDGAVSAVAFSPDEKLALSASKDGTIRLWDLATEKEVDAIDLTSSADAPTSLAFVSERDFVVGTTRGAVLRFQLLSPDKK
ncbi:hypothetical protein HY251_00985 [bacterium]|nr:hypothetical protein [bacterium]